MTTVNQPLFPHGTRKKKKHVCNVKALKKNPQRKGVCVVIRIVKPKKPNSAQRKVVKVKISKKRQITAYIPGQGHNPKPFFNVLISGGRANDLPGVRFSLIRGKYDFNWEESFVRMNKRSKYGVSRKFYLASLNNDVSFT